MATTEEIKLKFTIDGKEVEVTLNNYQALLNQVVADFKKGSEDTITSWAKIGNAVTGVNQGLALLTKAYEFISKPVELAASFEQYEASLNVMLGSTDAAKSRISELVQFAKETPFELPGVVQAANQLQAMGQYSIDNLRMLGDLASASGKPMEQALSAYAKMVSGQKGIAVDMFRDLLITTDDWVKATGKGVTKNGELLASTSELIGAIPKIMKEKNFSGMMEEQAKTFNGQISNMKDALGQLGAAAGNYLLPVIAAIANVGTKLFTSLTPANDSLRDAQFEIQALGNRLIELKSKEELTREEISHRDELIKILNEKYKEYLGNLNLETVSSGQLAVQLQNINRQLELRIQLAAAEEELKDAKAQAVKIQKEYNQAVRDQATYEQNAIDLSRLKINEFLPEEVKKGQIESALKKLESLGMKPLNETVAEVNAALSQQADVYSNKAKEAQANIDGIKGKLDTANQAYKGFLENKNFISSQIPESETTKGTGSSAVDDSFAKNKSKITEEITLTRELTAEKDRLAKLDDRDVAFSVDEYKDNIEFVNTLMIGAKDEQTLKKLEYDKKYNEEALKLAENELKVREDLIDEDLEANRKGFAAKLKAQDELASEKDRILKDENKRNSLEVKEKDYASKSLMELDDLIVAKRDERKNLLEQIGKAETDAQLEDLKNKKQLTDEELDLLKRLKEAKKEQLKQDIQQWAQSGAAIYDSQKSFSDNMKALARESIETYINQAVMKTITDTLMKSLIPFPANIPVAIGAGMAVRAALDGLFKAMKFEKGGMVLGPSHKEGGVLIEAEGGEYVINRMATEKYFPLLNHLNTGLPFSMANTFIPTIEGVTRNYNSSSDTVMLGELNRLNKNFEYYVQNPVPPALIITKGDSKQIYQNGNAATRKSRV